MRKLFGVVLLAVALVSCATVSPFISVADKVSPSTVSLMMAQASGEDKIYCSGVAIRPQYILTAGHCLAGLTAEETTIIRDSAGNKLEAKLVEGVFTEGRFADVGHAMDMAVLFVKDGNYLPATIGNSDTLKPGQKVMLIGSQLGLFTSVTIGHVAYVSRVLEDTGLFIQTDVQSNPGNSGCPLFNEYGEVVGLNVRGGSGISLSVHINRVMVEVNRILKK